METDGTENRIMLYVEHQVDSIFSPKYALYNARVDTLYSEDDCYTPAGKDLYERLRAAETQEEANKIYKQLDSLEKSRRLYFAPYDGFGGLPCRLPCRREVVAAP